MGIQRNIEIRKLVTELMAIAHNELVGKDQGYVEHFWIETVRQAIEFTDYQMVRAPHKPCMTEKEALDFEHVLIPWGKHAGEEVGDVPPDYWLYLTEGTFPDDLKRYMRSQRFEARQTIESRKTRFSSNKPDVD